MTALTGTSVMHDEPLRGSARSSMAEQLKVEELWNHFQKLAEERMPLAFPLFYKVRTAVQQYQVCVVCCVFCAVCCVLCVHI